MKVKDLIKKLNEASPDNEVRLINSNKEDGYGDYTGNLYLSFDDVGDILIYDE